MKRIFALIALTVGIAMMAPSGAFACSGSTSQTYSPKLCHVVSGTAQRTTATAAAGTLPFTGLDVVLLAAGGGVLLGAGLVVRRLSRDLN